jgi:hypothetical protein
VTKSARRVKYFHVLEAIGSFYTRTQSHEFSNALRNCDVTWEENSATTRTRLSENASLSDVIRKWKIEQNKNIFTHTYARIFFCMFSQFFVLLRSACDASEHAKINNKFNWKRVHMLMLLIPFIALDYYDDDVVCEYTHRMSAVLLN